MKIRSLVIVLLLVDVALLVLHFFLRKKLGFFDLDTEGNLASFVSGVKLWLAASASWIIAWIIARRGRSLLESGPFILLGAGLAYIGLDDMMSVHERIGFVLNNVFGTGGFYGESFNWLFYFSPFMVLALVLFYWCALQLWRTQRRAVVWLLSGVALWVLSIGTEFYGRSLILAKTVDVPYYHAIVVLEEGLEFFGATAITVALACYLFYLLRTFVQVTAESAGD